MPNYLARRHVCASPLSNLLTGLSLAWQDERAFRQEVPACAPACVPGIVLALLLPYGWLTTLVLTAACLLVWMTGLLNSARWRVSIASQPSDIR